MGFAVIMVSVVGVYAGINFDLSLSSASFWIIFFYGLVLLSNLKKVFCFVFNPGILLEFVWFPRIQFAADRNGMFFTNAWKEGRFPEKDEVVFVEWDKVGSIFFESRMQRRTLVIKLRLNHKEKEILRATDQSGNMDEMQFTNEFPGESRVLNALKNLRNLA